LRSIDLNVETRKILISQINALASDRHSNVMSASAAQIAGGDIVLGGGKGKLTQEKLASLQKRHEDTLKKWEAYITWVTTVLRQTTENGAAASEEQVKRAMQGEDAFSPNAKYCYDIVIDGANLGYFKQNYGGAPTHVDYEQVNWAVRQLQRQGHRPLIVLHQRHVNNKKLSANGANVVAGWRADKLLYETPNGCNDDWFWLHMAVVMRAKMLTNDEMRDHNFQMLSPRWFERWKERNQIHFSFLNWERVPEDTTNIISTTHWRVADFSKPKIYSHRMQCLLPKRSYAFPAVDSDTWLCIYKKGDGRDEED
jgi:hypothetical protein